MYGLWCEEGDAMGRDGVMMHGAVGRRWERDRIARHRVHGRRMLGFAWSSPNNRESPYPWAEM